MKYYKIATVRTDTAICQVLMSEISERCVIELEAPAFVCDNMDFRLLLTKF